MCYIILEKSGWYTQSKQCENEFSYKRSIVPAAQSLQVLERKIQDMNKIGIIGAMELEVEELKSKMEVKQIVEKASMKFFEGVLNGKDVVIVQCGIGKVNAGMCVQILADVFGVDAVINTGVAGSLRAEINIGDIVVSKDACEHDMDVRPLGYEPGIIPQMATSFFEADRKLVETAMEVCREVNPDIAVYEGRVLSGDQFISDNEKKDWLISTFDGSCTEMEGAAIAHAAYLNNLAYVVIRAISDKADGSAQMDYPEFERAAAKHSAKLVETLVTRV